MIRALILDFDGVLVESVDIKTEGFREYFGRVYPQHVEEIVRYHLKHNGVSRIVKFRHIFEHILGIPFTEQLKEKVCRDFSNLVKQKVIECPMVKGAPEFLAHYSRWLPMYLCSATPHDELLEIAETRGLACFFKSIFGFPTTKDQIVGTILLQEACRPHEILMIGDSLEDLRSAQERGVLFLARRSHDDFSGHGIKVFSDMREIDEYLEGYVAVS